MNVVDVVLGVYFVYNATQKLYLFVKFVIALKVKMRLLLLQSVLGTELVHMETFFKLFSS